MKKASSLVDSPGGKTNPPYPPLTGGQEKAKPPTESAFAKTALPWRGASPSTTPCQGGSEIRLRFLSVDFLDNHGKGGSSSPKGSHRQYRRPEKPGAVTIAGKPGDDLPPDTVEVAAAGTSG